MKIWFIRHSKESLGPYSIEELKTLAVTKEDYVWKEGLSDWMQAGSLPELAELFAIKTPPPFTSNNNNYAASSDDHKESYYSSYSYPKKQSSTSRYLPWIGLLFVLSIVAYFIYAQGQSAHHASPYGSSYQKSPEQLRAELAATEKQNPGQYISGRTGHRKNIIGQTVIEGTLTNAATIAVFKDVVLQVDFLSKTNSIITTKSFTVYEVINPAQTVKFKEKTYVPKEVQNIQVTIIGATPTN